MPYVVGPLPRERIDQAYALVRLARPKLAREAWTALADALLGGADAGQPGGGSSGIVGLYNAQDYLFGLFCHRVRDDRQDGRFLEISHFIVMAPIGAEAATDQLCAEMERLRRAFGCRSIDLEPAGPGPLPAPRHTATPEP